MQGVVKFVLFNSLKLTCVHRLLAGLEKQLCRLPLAGYGSYFVSSIILGLVKCCGVGRSDGIDKRELCVFHISMTCLIT